MTSPHCYKCGRTEDKTLNDRRKFTVELRPYGPGGQDVCCDCAFGTSEDTERTKAAFGALLDAAASISPIGAAVIGAGHDRGPDPFDAGASPREEQPQP